MSKTDNFINNNINEANTIQANTIQANTDQINSKSDKNNHGLNNIKYKTSILNTPLPKKNIIDMDDLLEKESNLNKLEPWCKLDKTMKLTKLAQYSDTLIKEHNLSQEERENLKTYFSNCLDKKNLQKVKDVTYDRETGIIKNIPLLTFNNTTRKFLLKKDKHVSTLKSLAPKKKKSNLNITDELQHLEINKEKT